MPIRHLQSVFGRIPLSIMLLSCIVALTVFALIRQASGPVIVESRLLVGQAPTESTHFDEEERYYGWLRAEYTALALGNWGRGSRFAELVRNRLRLQGIHLSLEEVQESLSAGADSSRVILRAVHKDSETAKAIALAATETMATPDRVDIPQLQGFEVLATPLHDELFVRETVGGDTILMQLRIPVALFAGLMTGFMSSWLRDQFDLTIHSMNDARQLGMPMLGEVPDFQDT